MTEQQPEEAQEQGLEQQQREYILDPRYSRPFNMAVWTDDPGLAGLAEAIWQEHFAEREAAKTAGRKPGRPYVEQLRAVITDLYLAWQEDPDLCLGVPFSEGAWNSGSRYNPLGLSKHLVKLLRRLQAVGLVRVAEGSFSGPGAKGNRTSRIQAGWALQQRFRQVQVQPGAIREVPTECIILKAGEGDDSRPIEYEDTVDTRRMRKDLEAYNALLARTFIDIPALEKPLLTRLDTQGRTIPVPIGPRNQQVRRIFSRDSWSLNGRFYGPWWQGLNSDLRSQIFINDTPTVEIDFRAMHIQILAAQEGAKVTGDPYELPPGQFPGTDQKDQRDLVKLLVLTALNARTLPTACSAFRDGLEPGHPGKHLKNTDLKAALTELKRRVPWLHRHLCKDQGIRLMFIDSRIMERVINRCTSAGLPVLTVHDSVIVPYTHSRLVQGVMRQAASEVVGRELPVEVRYPGLAEFRDAPVHIQQDFETWRETARCEGYLARLRGWEAMTGEVVVPGRMKTVIPG